MRYSVLGIKLPIVEAGDDLGEMLKGEVEDGDVLVLAQAVVSRAEGRTVSLEDVEVSKEAEELAKETGKDPRLCQVILGEGEVVATALGTVITEIRGRICANAGVDASNTPEGTVTLLPKDPDASARRIRDGLGKEGGVVVSDSSGRPFREGAVGVAIGCAGLEPLVSHVGEEDLFGRELESSEQCVADEAASAANLLFGEGARGIPAAVIRGLDLDRGDEGCGGLGRSRGTRLFSPGRWG